MCPSWCGAALRVEAHDQAPNIPIRAASLGGNRLPKTTVADCTLFEIAGVKHAHPHRFRDTFAVELLLAGVALDQVSILLGHSFVKITERVTRRG